MEQGVCYAVSPDPVNPNVTPIKASADMRLTALGPYFGLLSFSSSE